MFAMTNYFAAIVILAGLFSVSGGLRDLSNAIDKHAMQCNQTKVIAP